MFKAIKQKLGAFTKDVCKYDHDMIWVPREGIRPFNIQGFRGDILTEKNSKTIKIFTLGDSNTIGFDSTNGYPCYPQYLEDILNHEQSEKKYIVINAGVWGYSSYQGLKRFEMRILPYKPDIVTICFGWNDAHGARISDKDFAENEIRENKLDKILEKLRLGQLALNIIDAVYVKFRRPIEHRVSIEEYEKNIRKTIIIAKENNICPILITRAYSKKNGPEDYNNKIREIAKKENILLVDQKAMFANHDEYFLDDNHFNEAGHKAAAQKISEIIKNNHN